MKGADEFWAAVDQSGGPGSCWLWRRSRNLRRRGYGQVNWRGRIRLAHRVAYELATGAPITEGLPLDHTCHDPNICVEPCPHTACCNPMHLEPVTQAENNARRATDSCGQGHPKTAEHGRSRGTAWRCVTCDTCRQRERRQARRAA